MIPAHFGSSEPRILPDRRTINRPAEKPNPAKAG